MKWGLPPKIKIYEALGTLADGRIELQSKTSARVYSSSGGKFYTVSYDPEKKSIMANDNGSYWQGTLGYPAIAFLLLIGELHYDKELPRALKGIAWKDINTQFKNNFEKTILCAHKKAEEEGVRVEALEKAVASIEAEIRTMDLSSLGQRKRPPAGY